MSRQDQDNSVDIKSALKAKIALCMVSVWLIFGRSGTGVYVLPEIGEVVLLRFPSEKKEDGYIDTTLREDRKRNRKKENPNVRLFGTAKGGRKRRENKNVLQGQSGHCDPCSEYCGGSVY